MHYISSCAGTVAAFAFAFAFAYADPNDRTDQTVRIVLVWRQQQRRKHEMAPYLHL